MKKLSQVFACLALALSHVMCAVVAYEYRSLQCCGMHGLCSAPPWVAFYMAIPFGIGIAVCLLLYVMFKKRAKIVNE